MNVLFSTQYPHLELGSLIHIRVVTGVLVSTSFHIIAASGTTFRPYFPDRRRKKIKMILVDVYIYKCMHIYSLTSMALTSLSSVQPTNILPSAPLVYLNLFIFKNPAGSNPTSPAIDPSSLAGCSKRGQTGTWHLRWWQ